MTNTPREGKRWAPFKMSPEDRKDMAEARERLVAIRDRMPADHLMASVPEVIEIVSERKGFTEFVNEIVSDIEYMFGYQ